MCSQQQASPSNETRLEFLEGLTSEIYIQLALITEQIGSMTKIMWAKGLLTQEELEVINEDMETLIERFSELSQGGTETSEEE